MRKNLIFSLFLSSFMSVYAFATPVYVEFGPGWWSFEDDIFSFEQNLAIIYTEGADELLEMIIDLPDLTVNGSAVTASENLNIYDGSELFLSESVDSGTFLTGLRSDIVYYYLDMTALLPADYEMIDVELILAKTGSRADTFTGSVAMVRIPEPTTAAILGFGVLVLVKRNY